MGGAASEKGAYVLDFDGAPDGRPHTMPVWADWMDGKIWFSTGRETVKARNMAANPNVVVSIEIGKDDVIVEGVVEETSDLRHLKKFAAGYKKSTTGKSILSKDRISW